MPGVMPGIHLLASKQDVDGGDKPGHDVCAWGDVKGWITTAGEPHFMPQWPKQAPSLY